MCGKILIDLLCGNLKIDTKDRLRGFEKYLLRGLRKLEKKKYYVHVRLGSNQVPICIWNWNIVEMKANFAGISQPGVGVDQNLQKKSGNLLVSVQDLNTFNQKHFIYKHTLKPYDNCDISQPIQNFSFNLLSYSTVPKFCIYFFSIHNLWIQFSKPNNSLLLFEIQDNKGMQII